MLTRHAIGRVYNYDYCIGRPGLAGGAFYFPTDFALGSGLSLYVLSKGNEYPPSQGITKCTLDHEVLWEARGSDFADGNSFWPSSIALDSHEHLYVSEEHAGKIFIFDPDGQLLESWGTKGSGEGELGGPSGLAFDSADNLYVVESLNHRVQSFTRDGRPQGSWGTRGGGEGQLDMPWGIALDGSGDVYVADWKNDRVQKFTTDGQYLASFGTSGTGDGQLHRPTAVAIDREGDVYVTDWGNDRLNIYAADGTFITAFMGDADTLSPWGQAQVDANPDLPKARKRVDLTPERRFMRPLAVNVDDEGRIMVLESPRCRIQIYVKERDWVEAQFNL